ncbi:MADF domain-containing protein [Trichostrongylus colubriformis]|uniref:MADF domain-containing protein n=1 Tax=Trichostrongylus colubriformis TaxID=6319 RepID=A0AAN8G442_TRICO
MGSLYPAQVESYHVRTHNALQTCKSDDVEFNSERKEVSTEWLGFDEINYEDDIERFAQNKAYDYALRTELIALVEANKCLWDNRTEYFRIFDMKARAWEDIRKTMKGLGYDLDVRGLKKIWRTLRDSWRKIKRNTTGSMNTTWAYSKHMKFLETVENFTGAHCSNNAVNTHGPPSTQVLGGSSKRKASVLDEDAEAIRDAPRPKKSHPNASDHSQDQFSAFGQMVTEVLRSMPLETAKAKMHVISTALFAVPGNTTTNER